MKQILNVFKFTFKEGLRRKSFIIVTIIMMVLVLGLSLLPKILDHVNGNPSEGDKQVVYYIDEENIIPSGASFVETLYPKDSVKVGNLENLKVYKKEVEEGKETTQVIEVRQTDGGPKVVIYGKDFKSNLNTGPVVDVLSKAYNMQVLAEAGVPADVVSKSQITLISEVEYVGENTISNFFLSIGLVFLMFFTIYYYGYGVAMTVVTEKTSRVMEVLVVSAKPSTILIGKIWAMGTLGLAQVATALGFGALCFHLFLPKDMIVAGMEIGDIGFSQKLVLVIVLYFLLGYSLYAVMNAVCGALVSKMEDLSSAMMPVTLIGLLSFYLAYISSFLGADSMLSKIAVYLPFSSPFIIPLKVLDGTVTLSTLMISAAILVVTIVVVVRLSIGVYSASVFNYGKRQRLITLFKTRV